MRCEIESQLELGRMSDGVRRSNPTAPNEGSSIEVAASSAPLQRRAARVLLAAADPMLPDRPTLSRDDRLRVEGEMEIFLARQVFSMPRYLLIPFLFALFAFEALPASIRGRPFSALEKPDRAHIVDSWSHSRIAQKRDLVKLIRNCSLYFYLDHPLVRASFDREANTQPDAGGGA